MRAGRRDRVGTRALCERGLRFRRERKKCQLPSCLSRGRRAGARGLFVVPSPRSLGGHPKPYRAPSAPPRPAAQRWVLGGSRRWGYTARLLAWRLQSQGRNKPLLTPQLRHRSKGRLGDRDPPRGTCAQRGATAPSRKKRPARWPAFQSRT